MINKSKSSKQKLPNLTVNLYKSCDRVHIEETAEIIKKQLKIPAILTNEKFKPIRLGVFDGMSRQKQMELYPEACIAHEKWEKGLIDIKVYEYLIDGMQPAQDYYDQVKGFIHELPDHSINILVGTRSDLSCLKNVFNQQTPEDYMAYKYYNFDYTQTLSAVSDNISIKETDLNFNSKKSFDTSIEKTI